MKKHLISTFLLVMAAVMLSGCAYSGWKEVYPSPLPSGVTPSPRPTPNAFTLEARSLVSRQEAETLVGNGLKDDTFNTPAPTPPSRWDGATHIFYAAQDGGSRFFQLALHQRTEDSAAMAVPKDIYDRLWRNTDKPVPVEGVGDEAFLAPPGLHLMAAGYYAVVAVGDPSDSRNAEILKKAGQLVADRIKAAAGGQ